MLDIPVDEQGSCGRNKVLLDIAKIHDNWELSKKAMIKHYKFTVAIENSIKHDYATGKLWQPLAADSVPLYYGGPNIDD